MALKNADKVKFNIMSEMFDGLVASGMDLEIVKSAIDSQVKAFEAESNHQVRFVEVDGKFKMEVLDLSKDFVRVRNQNEENKVLRTKIQGVGIDVKLWKLNDFEFTNEELSSSLRALADEIDGLSDTLSGMEPCDVRKLAVEEDEAEELEEVSDEDLTEGLSEEDEDLEGEEAAEAPQAPLSEGSMLDEL